MRKRPWRCSCSAALADALHLVVELAIFGIDPGVALLVRGARLGIGPRTASAAACTTGRSGRLSGSEGVRAGRRTRRVWYVAARGRRRRIGETGRGARRKIRGSVRAACGIVEPGGACIAG